MSELDKEQVLEKTTQYAQAFAEYDFSKMAGLFAAECDVILIATKPSVPPKEKKLKKSQFQEYLEVKKQNDEKSYKIDLIKIAKENKKPLIVNAIEQNAGVVESRIFPVIIEPDFKIENDKMATSHVLIQRNSAYVTRNSGPDFDMHIISKTHDTIKLIFNDKQEISKIKHLTHSFNSRIKEQFDL